MYHLPSMKWSSGAQMSVWFQPAPDGAHTRTPFRLRLVRVSVRYTQMPPLRDSTLKYLPSCLTTHGSAPGPIGFMKVVGQTGVPPPFVCAGPPDEQAAAHTSSG